MPELPEVETTRRGLAPHCVGRLVRTLTVRDARLRWPVDEKLSAMLPGMRIRSLSRRAKYLQLHFDAGLLLVHLGMSGSFRVLTQTERPGKHDHIDLILDDGVCLRYNDPRRFGSFLWFDAGTAPGPLAALGPEPLDEAFSGAHLYRRSRGRRIAVKPFIMDASNVVGVGNIYATEALFLAGIRPDRAAGRVAEARYEALASSIKQVLTNAIDQGGTTLRDFVGGDGKPGYFAQQLFVYGRAGEPCKTCGTLLRSHVLGQRASTFCIACQR
ncbi:MAG: bifunctional DNA-formamidopyrimidine glycosylase/DNA-(apurinic or apyrimidinic site) lyase [Pseudomonadota bacterium]